MKNKQLSAYIAVLVASLMAAPSAHAQQDSADLARSVFRTQATEVAVKETSTPTPAPTPGPSSINVGAGQGKDSQSGAAMMNALASAALIAACMSSDPPNMALCAMGALAAMQAGHDSGTSGESGNVQNVTTTTTPNGTQTPAVNPNPASGTSGFAKKQLDAANKALNANGYSITSAGLTSPDGTLTPASALSTDSGMASAGFSAEQAAEAKKVLAAVNDEASKLRVASVGVSEGGAGSASSSNSSNEDNGSSSVGPNPFSLNRGQKNALVAGKTVLFDGEPIGVKGQNIFEMVHVAYDRKREGHHFLDSGPSGAATAMVPASTTVRAPASVKNFGVQAPNR